MCASGSVADGHAAAGEGPAVREHGFAGLTHARPEPDLLAVNRRGRRERERDGWLRERVALHAGVRPVAPKLLEPVAATVDHLVVLAGGGRASG